MGYRDDSTYRGEPYLDIRTPEGLIDMSRTGIPLVGTDETGLQKLLPPYSGLHRFRGTRVRETPLQKGGLPSYYELMFEDDAPEEEDPAPAPASAAASPPVYQPLLQPDSSQDDLAMEAANWVYAQPSLSEGEARGAYSPSVQGARGIDPSVQAATSELLQLFPRLRVTSTIRNWGDKDAHPKGRAIDVAGPDLAQAFQYYKNTLVPKYKFNPALNPNHGTGPHIHVGYYRKGGLYRPNR